MKFFVTPNPDIFLATALILITGTNKECHLMHNFIFYHFGPSPTSQIWDLEKFHNTQMKGLDCLIKTCKAQLSGMNSSCWEQPNVFNFFNFHTSSLPYPLSDWIETWQTHCTNKGLLLLCGFFFEFLVKKKYVKSKHQVQATKEVDTPICALLDPCPQGTNSTCMKWKRWNKKVNVLPLPHIKVANLGNDVEGPLLIFCEQALTSLFLFQVSPSFCGPVDLWCVEGGVSTYSR